MSKYDRLRDHLRAQTLTELVLTFIEIEALVGPLPPSAERPQWWANVRGASHTSVQRNAWGAAGYDAFLIAGSRKVRFRKAAGALPAKRRMATEADVVPSKPPLTHEMLLQGGFQRASGWVRTQAGELALDQPLPSVSGVYAFVKDGRAFYVGIAASGFARRLGFYIRPGVTQRTSQRVRELLLRELATGSVIDILIVTPPAVSWNGWDIDTSAGLEVALIARHELAWNLRGV